MKGKYLEENRQDSGKNKWLVKC